MINIDWSDRTSGKVTKILIDYYFTLSENVKKLTEWLKGYKQREISQFATMYHATGKDVPVSEQGLLARYGKSKNFHLSESGYVYLSPNPNYARKYGEMAFAGHCVVYEVIMPIKKLLPDKMSSFYKRVVYEMLENCLRNVNRF